MGICQFSITLLKALRCRKKKKKKLLANCYRCFHLRNKIPGQILAVVKPLEHQRLKNSLKVPLLQQNSVRNYFKGLAYVYLLTAMVAVL